MIGDDVALLVAGLRGSVPPAATVAS